MPTAHDYRTAAARFRQLARSADDHAAALIGWRAGQIITGPLLTEIDAALDDAATQLHRAGLALAELIETCERRAVVCQAFQADVDAWYASIDERRLWLGRPDRPFAWVETA